MSLRLLRRVAVEKEDEEHSLLLPSPHLLAHFSSERDRPHTFAYH